MDKLQANCRKAEQFLVFLALTYEIFGLFLNMNIERTLKKGLFL